MKILNTKAGAFATVAIVIAMSFGAAGAIAQDPAAPGTPETMQATNAEDNESTIRFVPGEVVQELPETVEAEQPASSASSLGELVDTADNGEAMSREMRCLAQAVYFEARGEPLDGQLAVARVVINRAESALFPNDYCAVVTQRAQFSFVRGGQIPAPNRNSSAWKRARAIAQIAHQELWDSKAGDALFFHATHVQPGWSRKKARLAQIDRHIFYR